MPRYATVDGLHTRLPYVGSVTNLSSADKASFIDDAESVLEAKVAKKYTIPVSDSPYFNKLARDAALCEILGKRVFTQERQNQSEWVSTFCQAYDRADEVAAGKIPLITSSGDLVTTRNDVTEVWSNTMDYAPTFDELGRLDHIVDEDKKDDLKDDKDL